MSWSAPGKDTFTHNVCVSVDIAPMASQRKLREWMCLGKFVLLR